MAFNSFSTRSFCASNSKNRRGVIYFPEGNTCEVYELADANDQSLGTLSMLNSIIQSPTDNLVGKTHAVEGNIVHLFDCGGHSHYIVLNSKDHAPGLFQRIRDNHIKKVRKGIILDHIYG